MRKVVWLVVRDEEFYIDMAIECAAKYVDGIYVLDTGSKDGTFQTIFNLQKKYKNIVYEYKEFGGDSRFGIKSGQKPGFAEIYREKDARNYAIEQALVYFKPVDWLVQLDADEVVNERYWEILDTLTGPDDLSFGHSTCVPYTPYLISDNPQSMVVWKGIRLFDPHVRAWSTKLHVKWAHPEGRHVIPKIVGHDEDLPVYRVTKDHVHFHLHRAFGPKSIHAWLTQFSQAWGQASETLNIPIEDIFNQKVYKKRYPEWFKDGKFNPDRSWHEYRIRTYGATKISHPLPDFVVKKWEDWGKWW